MSNNIALPLDHGIGYDTCAGLNRELPETYWPEDVFGNDRSVKDRIRAQILIAKTPVIVEKESPSGAGMFYMYGGNFLRAPNYYWVDSGSFPQTVSITAEKTAQQQLIETIRPLYQCGTLLHLKIAERLISLYRDAIAEDETLLPDSIRQLGDFFLGNPNVGLPKITLTPNHTLRARWIRAAGNFTAIEFTGTPIAKLVAEIPRTGGSIARYFAGEPIETIVQSARAIGAEFS